MSNILQVCMHTYSNIRYKQVCKMMEYTVLLKGLGLICSAITISAEKSVNILVFNENHFHCQVIKYKS